MVNDAMLAIIEQLAEQVADDLIAENRIGERTESAPVPHDAAPHALGAQLGRIRDVVEERA